MCNDYPRLCLIESWFESCLVFTFERSGGMHWAHLMGCGAGHECQQWRGGAQYAAMCHLVEQLQAWMEIWNTDRTYTSLPHRSGTDLPHVNTDLMHNFDLLYVWNMDPTFETLIRPSGLAATWVHMKGLGGRQSRRTGASMSRGTAGVYNIGYFYCCDQREESTGCDVMAINSICCRFFFCSTCDTPSFYVPHYR